MHILFIVVVLSSSLVFAQEDKPNLIIIYTDEHNFRTIGAYRDILRRDQAFIWGNGSAVKTPHLDSLAKEGALLTNFYVVAPLCTPSRASFMTGLYPIATGASGNNDPLDTDMTTFAEILKKKKGYMTGIVTLCMWVHFLVILLLKFFPRSKTKATWVNGI